MLTQENAFENVAWKIVAILSQPQYINGLCVIFTLHTYISMVVGVTG